MTFTVKVEVRGSIVQDIRRNNSDDCLRKGPLPKFAMTCSHCMLVLHLKNVRLSGSNKDSGELSHMSVSF